MDLDPPELEPCPPIRVEWEGKATNPTPAMKRAYLHNKMGSANTTQTSKVTTEPTGNGTRGI